MALEKAVLLITATGESIPVQFNPEEYTLDDGNVFAEIGIPGLRTPPVQFVRGSGRSLRVELFFDTSASPGTDVRLQTQRVSGLLEKSPTLQGPSPLLFLWGGLQMPCVLEKVSQRFTRFLPSGVPVRAYLTLTLKEFATTTVAVQSGLFVLPPTVANLAGTNLAQVTAQTLGNPADWRVLANANNIDNPRTMDNRSTLAVPSGRTG